MPCSEEQGRVGCALALGIEPKFVSDAKASGEGQTAIVQLFAQLLPPVIVDLDALLGSAVFQTFDHLLSNQPSLRLVTCFLGGFCCRLPHMQEVVRHDAQWLSAGDWLGQGAGITTSRLASWSSMLRRVAPT